MLYKKTVAYIVAFSLALTQGHVSAAKNISTSSITSLVCAVSLLAICGWGKTSASKKIVEGKEELFDFDFPKASATPHVKQRTTIEQEIAHWRRLYAVSSVGLLAGVICMAAGAIKAFNDVAKIREIQFQETIRSVPNRSGFGRTRADAPLIPTTAYDGNVKDFVEYFNQLQDKYRAYKKKVKLPFGIDVTSHYVNYRPSFHQDWMHNGKLLELDPSASTPYYSGSFENVLYLSPQELEVNTDNTLSDAVIGKIDNFRSKCLNYMINCARAGHAAYDLRRTDKSLYPPEQEALDFAISHNELDRMFYHEVIEGLDALRNQWRKDKIKSKISTLPETIVDNMIMLLCKAYERADMKVLYELKTSKGGESLNVWYNVTELFYPQITEAEQVRYKALLEKNKKEMEQLVKEVGNAATACVKKLFEEEVAQRPDFKHHQWVHHKGCMSASSRYEKNMSNEEWLEAGWDDIAGC